MVRRVIRYWLFVIGWLFVVAVAFATSVFAQQQSDYYRIETYELPKGVNFGRAGWR